MNVPRYAELAARLLRSTSARTRAPTGERARGLATIEAGLRHRVAQRRARLAGAVLAAAATIGLSWYGLARNAGLDAAAVAAVSVASPLGAGATLRSADRLQPLQDAARIAAGQAVETPSRGGASVRLSTGTQLQLGADTSLRVDAQGATERFSLSRGELSAHVAKLASGQRFIVDTPDAEVEVRGTRFKLSVLQPAQTCSDGSRTLLQVSEGLVEVRRSGALVARVGVGQRWPADCEVPPAGVRTVTPRPDSTADAPGASHSSSASASSPRSTASGSTALTRQNDLFAEGVASRRQGDVNAALRAYQELITQFPSSPLAENAAVERLRLLASAQPARAREEARAYLQRYPRGFALDEARRLAGER